MVMVSLLSNSSLIKIDIYLSATNIDKQIHKYTQEYLRFCLKESMIQLCVLQDHFKAIKHKSTQHERT